MKEQRDIKRRIAMALRRYVVEKLPSKPHQVYFGCSQNFLRAFIRTQFVDGESWQGFGQRWKIGHVLAPGYFDMKREDELRLCWNWANLRVARNGEEKRILSADEALRVLSDRAELFPENRCIGEMIVRAYGLQGKSMTDNKMEMMELRNRYGAEEWAGVCDDCRKQYI